MARKPHPAGAEGERLAARVLKKKGCRILQRNFVSPSGEVDLVALDGDDVVFAEVKSRAGDDFAPPESSITTRKQRRIALVARDYCRRHNLDGVNIRFDVLSVLLLPGRKHDIRHFEGAFILPIRRRW